MKILNMGKSRIPMLLAYLVTFGGAIVMAGWILDIEVLKSILPMWVTMKFTTALLFFISGIILYVVTSSIENTSNISKIILTITTIIILYFLITLLVSIFLDIRSGLENLFVREYFGAIKTTKVGRPSIGTLINFTFIALIGVLTLIQAKNLNKKLVIIGLIIIVIASIAVFGYVISIPILYYSLENYSTAMAMHTAILFIIIGLGFFAAGKNSQNLLSKNKGDKVFLIFVLIIVIGLSFLLLLKNKKTDVSSLVSEVELLDHPIYSLYEFDQGDSAINIGFQPLYLPTGIIFELIKRDNILKQALSVLGKEIKYYPFLKGADVNVFLQQKKLDGGVGGDMPALSIASSLDLIIPVILQKGKASIVSAKPMLTDDLIDKNIGYPYGSISHYFILELLQSAGIPESKVNLIPMELSEMAKALNNSEIDLFSAWEPNVASALKQYPDFFITYQKITTGYLYFSKNFVQENPEIANYIIAAVIRSISWMKSNNDNLLQACEWNIREMEKLTKEKSILNAQEMAELTRQDIFRYYSMYSIVISDNDISNNSNLFREYEFLKALNSNKENRTWEDVVKSFDNNMINEIFKRPNEFHLNDYDYILNGD
jgi:ABC-type nitrate/sulfonate/bicarbonate transport system substrate-binding protein